MADPKYADLPGIAHDEPDVYETTDLPESEQAEDFYEPENEPIERIHISSEEAYNKFKGKFLNSSKVDFSEQIGKRVRTGYDARSGDWELVGFGEKETPIQKFQRLQCEMNELLKEVNAINKNKDENEQDCIVPTEQVEHSLRLLADMKLEESLGEDIMAKISDPEGASIKKLLSQLEQFKQNIDENPESENQAPKDSIVYNFNCKLQHEKLKLTSRFAALESRLRRLETVLGSSDDKLSRLATATNKGSLLEAAQYLSATASLLDSSQLDHIEGRLAGLAQKLEAIGSKKKELQHNDANDKMISELYDIVKNRESIVKLLPQTVDRLKSLESLHQKATDFTKTLTQMELVQSEIKGNVENNKALLQGVQESFAMNLNEINNTVINLDARIKALKK